MIKSIYILPLLVMVYISTLNGGTIKGTVKDKNTNDPLYNCIVEVVGTTNGAHTEMNGDFIITGVRKGNYVLRVAQVGYCDVKQSIMLSGSEQETCYVGIILIESYFFLLTDTPESMGYQEKLRQQAKPISIILNNPYWDTTGLAWLKYQATHDSHYQESEESRENKELILSDKIGFLKIDCSIINHTEVPIYLSLDYQHISFQFDNPPESRKQIENPVDAIPFACQPLIITGIIAATDSIEILPFQTRVNIPLQIISNFHGYFEEGTYTMSVKYSFDLPLIYCQTPEWQRNINRMALRGEFNSENKVTFEVER